MGQCTHIFSMHSMIMAVSMNTAILWAAKQSNMFICSHIVASFQTHNVLLSFFRMIFSFDLFSY